MRKHLLAYLFLLVSIQAYCQNCTLSVAISQSSQTVCTGYNVTLTATTSGGTGPFTYAWNTGQTTSSIVVDKAGTYKVTVTDKTPGCQPVSQSVTITAGNTPNAPSVSNQTVCANTSATLTATAPGGTYQWYDAPTGGNFLSSGATYVTPPITKTSVYYVQTTIGGCTSLRTQVFVYTSSGPTVRTSSTCSGNVATLIASGGSSYIWYDAPTGGNVLSTSDTYTTPPLNTSTTYYVSSVSQSGCESPRTSATVTVNTTPQRPTASNATVCAGTSANLHATGTNVQVFNWYAVPSGGTPLISSPDFTTPPLTTNTTYYVSGSSNNCESGRTPVTVTVSALPTAPTAPNDTICYQSSATLTASSPGAATFQWYDAPNGKQLATGATYTTPVLANSTNYYVQSVNGGCVSGYTEVNVTVRQPLDAPTAAGDVICSGSSATLTASASGGGIFQWYNAATGGTLLATAASYTTPVLNATTTYYVQNVQNGCVSPRTAVKVTVLPAVSSPTASGTTICSGDSATLTASGSGGGYAWYNAATGGTLLSTAQVFVTPALTNTTTYYVQATLNGCGSAMVPVTVTVAPTPVAPTVNGATICQGMTATLTATGATGTVQWYSAASGGKLLATGNQFTTPALNTTTTYYAQSVSGQCMSQMVPATVTVNSNSQFQYPGNTFCTDSPNPTPTINNPSGGVFSSTPGLVFVSDVTGEINIAGSTPGSYTVTFSGTGSCTVPDRQLIVITSTPNAKFTYNSPFCQGGANPSPVFANGASGGTFKATPGGLVFINTSSGEIDLKNSKPGTYTVTNTIIPSGSCPSASASASVTIDPMIVVNAGPDQTVATGTTVQLAGSVSGGATTGTWSGGTGSFSNASDPTAKYMPGAGETKAVLTLTSASAGACGAVSASVTITFSSQPGAPTVASVTDCSGSSATLSATGPGGTYQWYDAATGGNLLNTGPDFTTPPLTGNTTYYVQTTVNGATSSRTPVTITINPVPAAPVATGTQTCSGSTATLTASGSTGSYEWYDAPAGGNLVANTASFTTPVLNANTSYYVQTTTGGCTSTRTEVDITVTAQPYVTSNSTGTICSGQPLDYLITANIANTTFAWSRAQTAGISNPAANQTSSTITETLVNTTNNPVQVTYVITPMSGSCSGNPFNYVVTVYPAPSVTSAASATICDATSADYAITFSGPVTSLSWGRAAVPGINNQPVSGQTASTIREVLFNTSDTAINVTYAISYNTSSCSGIPFNFTVTVLPQDSVTSAPSGKACSGVPQNYVITTNLPGSTFTWSRNAANGISNPAVSNQTSGTITESLVNTTLSTVNVNYYIVPTANGCPGVQFKYQVAVNPATATANGSSNSPICVGTDLKLTAAPVNNATYLWTGPNGFTSTDQNPVIKNATTDNSGAYTLVFTNSNGCSSLPTTVQVSVDPPPVVDAGNDTSVCILTKAVKLNGSVTGGTSTGIWATSGTGTFSPSANILNATYVPSSADTTAGAVELTLSSTSQDNCAIVSDSLKLSFTRQPAAIAGNNQNVCSQTAAVQLDGQVTVGGSGTWSTEGTGTFTPSASQLNAIYVPSAADVAKGHVVLKLTAANAGACNTPTDSLTVFFIPPPTVYAGGTRYVLKGSAITLYPTVSESDVHYLWSPNIDINNDTLKNPEVTGDINRVYTLTVTDVRGCVASDTLLVVVSPVIKIVNTFTPNGDGVNDYWDIDGLIAYNQATVDIFDRWGQRVFHSLGYPKPWDGNYNGKPVPVGVYYYIIDTHFYGQVLSGYVTVIR